MAVYSARFGLVLAVLFVLAAAGKKQTERHIIARRNG